MYFFNVYLIQIGFWIEGGSFYFEVISLGRVQLN